MKTSKENLPRNLTKKAVAGREMVVTESEI
jgi:hypothetical protein